VAAHNGEAIDLQYTSHLKLGRLLRACNAFPAVFYPIAYDNIPV
jgi:hypothetical protein